MAICTGTSIRTGKRCAKIAKGNQTTCSDHEPNKVEKPTCEGISKNSGKRCKRKPRKGKTTCGYHDPNKVKKFTCNSVKTRGGRCTREVKFDGERCSDHQESDKYIKPPDTILKDGQCEGFIQDDTRCKWKPTNGETTCRMHKPNKTKGPTCTESKSRGGKCTHSVGFIGDKCLDHRNDGLKCGELTTSNVPCLRVVTKEGDKCQIHGGPGKIEKEVRKDERTVMFCPKCDTKERWISLKEHGFGNYVISSIGRIYNIKTYKLSKDDPMLDSGGYVRVLLTNDDGNRKGKRIATWQGAAFFDLKLVYGKERNPITIDHINRNRADNYVCCNLRPYTNREQGLNQTRPKYYHGKTVYKTSLDSKTILEKYISINQASDLLKMDVNRIKKFCNSEEEVDGYKLRFMTREDTGNEKWYSSEVLYPEYQPSFWVSAGGWIERRNGVFTKGSFSGKYYSFGFSVNNDRVYHFVHDVVWEIITGRKIRDGYEISHINDKCKDNRYVNLEEDTHPNNMMNAVKLGNHGSAIKVRQIFHDETPSRIYLSIRQACEMTGTTRWALKEVLKGEQSGAGDCKCGLRYHWEIVTK